MKKLAQNFISCLIIALLVFAEGTQAETYFSSENTVSTGKVIINGMDMSADFQGIVGSGIRAKKTNQVDAYTKVSIAGGFDVEFQPGDFLVEIEGDDNLLNLPKLNVQQDTLTVSIHQSYKTERNLIVRIFSPRLEAIKINGSSHGTLKNFSAETLLVDLAGTVDFVANGTVSNLILKIEGTGDVDTTRLKADRVTVVLNGSADVRLTVIDELKANVFGVGDIIYFGQPKKITRKIVGVGDINPG